MGSPLPLKIQADLKGDTACSYTSFAHHPYIWDLWRSNMAETRVEKESPAPKAPAAKFWLAWKGWIKDHNRPLSLLDSRGQDLSYETYDFRCT